MALSQDSILNAAKTSMNSKIVGVENEFFSQMVVDAIMSVKTFDDYGNPSCAPKLLLCARLRHTPPIHTRSPPPSSFRDAFGQPPARFLQCTVSNRFFPSNLPGTR